MPPRPHRTPPRPAQDQDGLPWRLSLLIVGLLLVLWVYDSWLLYQLLHLP